jgi:hypothetical protein
VLTSWLSTLLIVTSFCFCLRTLRHFSPCHFSTFAPSAQSRWDFNCASSQHLTRLSSNSSHSSSSPIHHHPTPSITTFNAQHVPLDAASLSYPGLPGSGTRVGVILQFSVYPTLTCNSTNLTVTFFPSASDNCAANGTADALIWYLLGIPPKFLCYNLEDVFNHSNPVIGDDLHNIQSKIPSDESSWRLLNTNAYSADINYSRILYKQENIYAPSPGSNSDVLFSVYSGRYCHTNSSIPRKHSSSLKWTCQSSVEGGCHEAPYNIMSFGVSSAKAINHHLKKCLTASTGTPTNGVGSGSTAATVGVIAMLVAGMLSW